MTLVNLLKRVSGGRTGQVAPSDQPVFDAAQATVQTPGETIARPFVQRMNELGIMPSGQGAKGDGVTPDDNALLAAATVAGATNPNAPFGRTVIVPKGNYRVQSILTLAMSGVRFVFEPGARLIRLPGDYPTLAVQGDRNVFENMALDWGWDPAGSESFADPGLRRACIYLTGNGNKFFNLYGRNAPGNFIQGDGMQRFGVRQDNVGSPNRVAYGPSVCGMDNVIEDADLAVAYFGGIIQYWMTRTKITRPKVRSVGSEALTFDTYTYGCDVRDIDFADIIVPGRGGGVGAIGADSGHHNRVSGGTISNVSWIGGDTAGIHLLNLENSTIYNTFANLLIRDCAGAGVYMSSDVASPTTVAGVAGQATSARYNAADTLTFVNCGADAGYRAMLASANGGVAPPANIGVYIDSTPSNPCAGNILDGLRLAGHAILDAPSASWVNDPTNPNQTNTAQHLISDLVFDRGIINLGARVLDRLLDFFFNGTDRMGFGNAPGELRLGVPASGRMVFGQWSGPGATMWTEGVALSTLLSLPPLTADPPVKNGSFAFVNGVLRKCQGGAWSNL